MEREKRGQRREYDGEKRERVTDDRSDRRERKIDKLQREKQKQILKHNNYSQFIYRERVKRHPENELHSMHRENLSKERFLNQIHG